MTWPPGLVSGPNVQIRVRETNSSPSEFNRLMTAAGRGLPVVTLSAAWRQVKDYRKPPEKGLGLSEESGGPGLPVREGTGCGPGPISEAANRTRRSQEREKEMARTIA